MITTTEGLEFLGVKDGRTYWHNPADLYVYQQLPDGTMNGWLCTRGIWDGWQAKGLFPLD